MEIWVLYEIYYGPEDASYFLDRNTAFDELRQLLHGMYDNSDPIHENLIRLEESGSTYIECYPYILYSQPVQ